MDVDTARRLACGVALVVASVPGPRGHVFGALGEDPQGLPMLRDWDASTGVLSEPVERMVGRQTVDVDRTLSSVDTGGSDTSPITVRRGAALTIVNSRLGSQVRVLDDDHRNVAYISHSEFDCECHTAVFGGAFHVTDSVVRSNGDGIAPTGGARAATTIIERNLIVRDGTRLLDRHHDGIQFWQGGNAVIRDNRITGFHTSAILIKSDRELAPGDGPPSHIRIEGNWLGNPTGFYTIYVRDGGFGRPRFVTIVDNAFDRGAKPISSGGTPRDHATFVRSDAERMRAVLAGVPGAESWIVWSGNYWSDTLEEIVPPGGWREVAPLPACSPAAGLCPAVRLGLEAA